MRRRSSHFCHRGHGGHGGRGRRFGFLVEDFCGRTRRSASAWHVDMGNTHQDRYGGCPNRWHVNAIRSKRLPQKVGRCSAAFRRLEENSSESVHNQLRIAIYTSSESPLFPSGSRTRGEFPCKIQWLLLTPEPVLLVGLTSLQNGDTFPESLPSLSSRQ